MIKRNYFALFIFLLAASVTLTACDSNDADDTEVVIEEEVTETETTVTTSDATVQQITAALAQPGSLGGIVGDNIIVDNSPGAIIQTTSTTSGASGTSSVTTTVAPLVNTTTGQPTGQVAVAVQSGGTTQTAIATPNVSNTASVSVATRTSTGSTANVNLNQAFNPTTIASSNASFQSSRRQVRQDIVAGGGTFAGTVTANGQTWAQRIQAAIAAGKRRNVQVELTAYNTAVLQRLLVTGRAVAGACSQNNSATETVRITNAGTTVAYACVNYQSISQFQNVLPD